MEELILVNECDEQTGTMEKMEAHIKGELHRAFSVFILNEKQEMLLQQRADCKYHSAGLWTNACCSHPRPGETNESAASRRLQEELGFAAPIKKIFDFQYHAAFENGLTEHEFDHVFLGVYEGKINMNPEEVKSITYLPLDEIANDININSGKYTAWFCIAFPKVQQWLANGGSTTL